MLTLKKFHKQTQGFTLVELLASMIVLGIVIASMFLLFSALINSSIITKRKAVASTLATNQMEYLKSLPYNSLAISGGSIYSTSPLPSTTTKKQNGVTYTIKTSINYADDAFDGCASYPTQTLKETYCRNYPAPSGAPATDTNPMDYKIAHVTVYDSANRTLAEVDTQISARVSETASTTGALFVTVNDQDGDPMSGAAVTVTNTTVTPNVSVSDTSDSNGIAIFYGLTPDTTGYDYIISASKADHSSLSTIAPSGSLQPNYPNQRVFSQLSSYVTLVIKPMTARSLVLEATTPDGTPLGNAKVYIKGGYKRYTLTSNNEYYYDNMSPADTRAVTGSDGLKNVDNLVPGDYYFCGDTGATSCSVGSTTYFLAAAVPYTGISALSPVSVPIYEASSPPADTFVYSGNQYVQKVRLLLTTNSNYPRLFTITPDEVSLATGSLSSFGFSITGANLPCSSSPASCSTTVKIIQDTQTKTASCTGSGAGTQLSCNANITGLIAGLTQLQVIANGNTLTLPAGPLIGGIRVTP